MKKENRLVRLLLLSFCIVAASMSFAFADNATFTVVPPAGSVNAGETFEVTATLSGCDAISSFQWALGFDKALMECTEIELSSALSSVMNATNPDGESGAVIAGASASNFDANGLLATYTFRALKKIESFEFEISKFEICNIKHQELNIDVTGAKLVKKASDEQKTDGDDSGKQQGSTPSGGAKDGSATGAEEQTGTAADETVNELYVSGFTDCVNHWGERYIAQAVKQGILKGYDEYRFGPDDRITRAQFVTVLYRLAGSPQLDGTAPFDDIAGQSDEFVKAISWAYRNGYVNGKTETLFDPAGYMTRQEAMKVLFGFSGAESGAETAFSGMYEQTFTDSAQIADWARPAMYWAIYHTLISGTSDTTLEPNGYTSRAQIAKILVIYSDKFNEKGALN